jgi:diguanylate cyclase (GGDEF)-like protein
MERTAWVDGIADTVAPESGPPGWLGLLAGLSFPGIGHLENWVYPAVVDALDEGVVVQGADGVVVLANPAAGRILGLPVDRLVGRVGGLGGLGGVGWTDGRWDAISEDGLAVAPARRCLVSGRPQIGELVRLEPSDGSVRWITVNSTPISDPGSGELVGVVSSFSDVTARRLGEAELERQALSDPLTGLANRALLADRIQQALHRSVRTGARVAVLLLDLDRFKVINDSLGHQVGDEVLMATARRLSSAARPVDTVARLGGDEFAIVAEGLDDDEELDAFACRIVAALRPPVQTGSEEVVTSASMGVAVSGVLDEGPTELMRQADVALYQAKELGRDRHARYDAELQAKMVERRAMERVVRRALTDDGLRIEYQPIVDLRTDRIVGAEALVRIEDVDLGSLLPERFIDVAEDSGLMAAIDAWVLDTAVAQVARWHRVAAGQIGLPAAVNVTARDLADPRFADRVMATLEANGLAGAAIHVEVTEQALLATSDSGRFNLQELRRLGVKVGLDDFGTGFSALSYLQNVPLDFVKIDRSFIPGITVSHRSHAIVAAVIELAHALGLEVIAEGVETADQLSALRRLRCDRAQGYLFSPSQTPDRFALMAQGLLHR